MIARLRRSGRRFLDSHRGAPFEARSGDGFDLKGRLHPVEGSEICIVACHGITSDSSEDGMFTALAGTANDRGISLLRFDFRGHGASAGSDRDFDLSAQDDDLSAVLREVEELGVGRLMPLGMSFGAAPVVRAARGGRFAGVALWSPVVDYARTCLRPETPWANELLAGKGSPELPDWAFARIPQTRFHISSDLARQCEIDDTSDALASLGVPVLAYSARGDEVVPFEPMAAVAGRNPKIDLRPLPEGTEHGLHSRRDEVIAGTLDWVEATARHAGVDQDPPE